MRDLSLLLLTVIALSATAAEKAEHPYPLWDGEESIQAYAKRVGLEPTRTIDLGSGVMMEMVLIPAGTFLMGTPEPPPVDEEGFHAKIRTGVVVLLAAGGLLLGLVGVVLVRAIRKRQRPQYSLAWFLIMAVVAGIGFLGALHWYFSARARADARREYQAAMARYLSSEEEEKPAHHVTISRPFYMGKYEVTQEQYQQVMGVNPSSIKGRPDLPVETVTWDDVQTYCRRVQEVTGEQVRLPSEAEWEYACRAGTRTLYHSGDDEASLAKAGLYYGNSDSTEFFVVGQKEPNAFGLYDMHGNMSEWCEDDGHDSYEGAPTDGSAWIGGASTVRIVRGGSWINDAKECRSAYRHWEFIPGCPCCRSSAPELGFRLVMRTLETRQSRLAREAKLARFLPTADELGTVRGKLAFGPDAAPDVKLLEGTDSLRCPDGKASYFDGTEPIVIVRPPGHFGMIGSGNITLQYTAAEDFSILLDVYGEMNVGSTVRLPAGKLQTKTISTNSRQASADGLKMEYQGDWAGRSYVKIRIEFKDVKPGSVALFRISY